MRDFANFANMTYKEALACMDRLKDVVIGIPVKEHIIESLFIAPTKWEAMCSFMNARARKGDEVAAIEYAAKEKSLSVYGFAVAPAKEGCDVPTWLFTNLDNWEVVIGN